MTARKDEMLPPLSDELERLLEAERQHAGPPPAAVERMRARVAASLGLPGGTGGTDGGAGGTLGGSGAPIAAGAAATGIKALGLVLFVAGIGVGVGGTLVGQRLAGSAEVRSATREPAAPSAPTADQGLAPVGTVVAVLGAVPDAAVSPPASTPATAPASRPNARVRVVRRQAEPRPTPVPPAATPVATGESGERALLERARAALARGTPRLALTTLREHRRLFAAGQLVEEREGLGVLVAIALRERDAPRRAKVFLSRYPKTLMRDVIESALDKDKRP